MDSLHARSPARGCEQTWWLNPWPHGARAVCRDGDRHVPWAVFPPGSLRGPTAALGHPAVLGQGAELGEATLGLHGVSRDMERGSGGSLVGAASPHLIPLLAQGHGGLTGLF